MKLIKDKSVVIDFVILVLVVVMLLLHAHAAEKARPNPQLTPGMARTATVKELCSTSTQMVRNTSESTKKQVCKAYGIKSQCPGPKWEIDHLISLELGGADTAVNLWPQPIKEAKIKDQLENTLHREICAGTLKLEDAQKCIASDWVTCYADHMDK